MSIIIVDDSKVNRLLLRRILEERGLKDLFEAGDVTELFALLGFEGAGQHPPACQNADLILMDIMMPDIDGIEATRRLHASQSFHDTPVIMVTAAGEGELLERAFAAGAMDYLTKPIDATELVARVKSALTLKREMDTRKARERELLELQNKLVLSNDHLNNVLKQIQADIELAAQTQIRMLPPQGAAFPSLQSHWQLLTCSRLGGDFLNLIPLSPRQTAFLLVDVSGHGIQAALLAFSLGHLLANTGGDSLLTSREGTPRQPGEMLAMLNQRFCTEEELGQYFTIAYGVFDAETRTVTISRAGHPPAIHLAAATGTARALREGGPPIGMVDNIDFPEDRFTVQPGDRLFLYSDGITETAAQDTGVLLGESGLEQILVRQHTQPLSVALEQVMQACAQWRGSREQADDMSILGLQFL
ncbi:MAG TPA: fused response regulator/phosphatase [Candidatus Ozemobacteraceae bacterium]|nr:fused response regulator/phosphatase [Candidatus Ozemobacteraceae bacterium]